MSSTSAEDQANTADSSRGDVLSFLPFRGWLLLAFGLPLTLASFMLVVGIEELLQIGEPTGVAIYYHVVVIFALIILLNSFVSRMTRKRIALSRPELLCLYSMMNIGACFACWESLGTLLPSLAYPIYLASTHTSDAWLYTVIAALPNWAVIKDPAAARALFEGGTFGSIWHAWFTPLLVWSGVLSTLFLMFLAMTRLFWDSWANHERLTFPLTALPLQMTQGDAAVWRSRLFWGTFAVAAGFDLLDGLHLLIPAMPYINIKVNFINTEPIGAGLTAVGKVPMTFHPLMIGIGLLLRTDLLFSTWFFYLIGLAQTYVAGLLSLSYGSKYVFLDNSPGLLAQNFGAILVIGGGLVWKARPVAAARLAAARAGDRSALTDFGIVGAGGLALTIFLCVLGLTVWLAVLSVLITLLLAIFVCRLRAELGLPVHNLQFMGPDGPLTAVFDGNGLTQVTQDAFGSFFAITRSQQGHPMPFLMESAVMTNRAGGQASRTWWILGVTGLLTAFIGPWVMLRMVSVVGLSRLGYNAMFTAGGWMTVHAYMLGRHTPDYGAIAHMAVGALVTLMLLALQRVWVTSPFHPVGYAISGSWGTGFVWMPFLVAWVAKTLALRYGGIRAHRSVTMIALGLIFGEFTAGMFWTIMSTILHTKCYQIWLY